MDKNDSSITSLGPTGMLKAKDYDCFDMSFSFHAAILDTLYRLTGASMTKYFVEFAGRCGNTFKYVRDLDRRDSDLKGLSDEMQKFRCESIKVSQSVNIEIQAFAKTFLWNILLMSCKGAQEKNFLLFFSKSSVGVFSLTIQIHGTSDMKKNSFRYGFKRSCF